MFRIKELKKALDKTNKQIAVDLNVSHHAVNSWTSGCRTPRLAQIKSIEKTYGLNPGWLTGENNDMYPKCESDHKRNQIIEIMTCQSSFAINTIYKLSEASESDWQILEKFLK
ncbi:helix-turn-helix transcriptional regulator [Clostridiales bacterium FE2011]|nr:helix-turn-helix transcriptional regulator [Clostridiales bacterium FE2011]